MPLVYCLIARGCVVECDASHPLHSGNFKLVALKLLSKVNQQHEAAVAALTSPASPPPTTLPVKRQTLLFDNHTFNFLSVGPLHCLALCTADVNQQTAFLFLADVMETYRRCDGGEESASGSGNGSGSARLQGSSLKAMSEVLHAKMEHYNHNSGDGGSSSGTTQKQLSDRQGAANEQNADEGRPAKQAHQSKDRKERERYRERGQGKQGSVSKKPSKQSVSSDAVSLGVRPDVEASENPDAVHNVKRELESVKDTLLGNIDRVLSRGEALENLVDRSDALHSSADQFKSASTRLHRHMRWQQLRTTITLLTMTAILAYFVAASRCGVTLKGC